MNMEKIAEKVQKLLNLAGNNPSQTEAQAALLKAQALIARYNLDIEQFAGNGEYEHDLICSKVRACGLNNRLGHIIANSFACNLLLSYDEKDIYRVSFFGRVDNAKTAV